MTLASRPPGLGLAAGRLGLTGLAFALASGLVACEPEGAPRARPGPASPAAPPPSLAPPAPPPAAAPAEPGALRLTPAMIGGHIRFLADDLLEGRAPGTRGSELAVKYIAAAMEAAGLEPAGENGTYFQKVPLVGIKAEPPARVRVRAPKGGAARELEVIKDLVVMSGVQRPKGNLAEAEVVFVGYGIVAPEYQWDDYKDVDVKGKVVLVMNNDPAGDPKLFGGKARLRYGRWDYKYEQAAKKGAAGVVIIHTDESAAYPWQVVVSSNARERFELPAGDEPRLEAKMWATEAASRAIAKLGGHDLDRLRAAAEARDFRPTPLGVRLGFAFANQVRKVESANVVGRRRGRDPALAGEAVVFTAHHDHLGVGAPNQQGDAIYNGALDNASGVAAILAIAGAAARQPPTRRSQLFVAVAAEEQGLLGSAYYCEHPTVPPGKMAANFNVDSVNRHGKTSDVSFLGYGKSSLDALVVEAARAQGREVRGDAYPEKGGFYRSDQYNFAKIGVPAVYLRGGPTFVGRPPGWGAERQKAYEAHDYHQPSDQYDDTWDLSGAVEDAELLWAVARRVADAPELPAWKPGDEFEAARKASLGR
ncbi:MAG TPA: M28 family peptidase [Polyangiaceae bacterium]|nr:M28 family peptidase [Polyangiaceae bacterium]